jgi:hypothetical protein
MFQKITFALWLLWSSVASANSIYKKDHWEYAQQLTESNFPSVIQSEIDAGRTLFVRWISSSTECEECKTQAPNWDKLIRGFSGNPDLAFGEIDVRTALPVEHDKEDDKEASPVFIRYYNQETGPEGSVSVRNTAEPTFEELCDEGMLIAYMEVAASTSLCSPKDFLGCDTKSQKFMLTKRHQNAGQLRREMERMEDLKDERMTATKLAWKKKRVRILATLMNNQRNCKYDGTDCTERSLRFLNEFKLGKTIRVHEQIAALSSMGDEGMSAKNKEWRDERIRILKAILKQKGIKVEEPSILKQEGIEVVAEL